MDIKIAKILVTEYALDNVSALDLDSVELMSSDKINELFLDFVKDTGNYNTFQLMELALTALYFQKRYEERLNG